MAHLGSCKAIPVGKEGVQSDRLVGETLGTAWKSFRSLSYPPQKLQTVFAASTLYFIPYNYIKIILRITHKIVSSFVHAVFTFLIKAPQKKLREQKLKYHTATCPHRCPSAKPNGLFTPALLHLA